MPRPLLLLVLVAALGASGCKTGKHIKIESWTPADVRLGDRDMLVLTEGEGRQSAHDFVIQTVAREARNDGYFDVIDRSLDGVTLEISGRKAQALHDNKKLPLRGLYLRADVVEWRARRRNEIVSEHEWVGPRRRRRYVEVDREVTVLRGTVLIEFTLVDHEGRTLLLRRDYEGEASMRADRTTKNAVLREAAADAVKRFLREITPQPRSTLVRVDETDQAQLGFIADAREGRTKAAEKGLQTYVKKHPDNAAAHYNLAIMLDALGYYEEAIEHYETAIRIGGPDWYERGRAACASRLREWKQL